MKNGSEFGRPALPIVNAAKQIECEIEDLIFIAKNGELDIYINIDYCHPESIMEIGFPFSGELRGPDVVYCGALRQCDYYDPSKSDSYTSEERFRLLDLNDVLSWDGVLHYARNGPHEALFRLYFGLQRVALGCIINYETNPSTSEKIELDISALNADCVSGHLTILVPYNEITFRDALRDNRLFVMKTDIRRLASQRINLQNHVNLEAPMTPVDFSSDPRWQQSDLKIAVDAWVAATQNYGLHDRPKDSIITWLEDKHPEMKPDRVKRLATVVNWSKAPGRAADGEK